MNNTPTARSYSVVPGPARAVLPKTWSSVSGLARVYVATGTAFDSEMEKRIAAHRTQRGTGWRTVEEQTDLAGVLAREARPGTVLLVDCLTLWLNNLMMAEKDLTAESARLCEAVSALAGPCLFVSNEVGMGIVPDNRLVTGVP